MSNFQSAMPDRVKRQLPRSETGWSSSHNVERKARHDFDNLVQELVYAVELGDRDLVAGYAEQLRQAYRAAAVKRAGE